MEKRALLAIVLSIAVMALWQIFLAPAPPLPPAPRAGAIAQPDAPQPAPSPAQPDAKPEASTAEQPPAPPAEAVQAAAAEEFRVITLTQDVRLTNEGGRVTWWRLPRHDVNGGVPVDLVPDTARRAGVLPLQIEIPEDPELTRMLATALYVHEVTDIAAGDPGGVGPGRRVSFRWSDGRGVVVNKSLELPQEGYLGRVSFEVTRDGKPVKAALIWASGLDEPMEDKTVSYGHVQGQGVLHDGSGVLRFPAEGVTEPRLYGRSIGTPVRWAGLESTYFAALLLPAADAGELLVSLQPRKVPPPTGTPARPDVPLITSAAVATGPASYPLFVGPKDFRLLETLGHELSRVVDFSRFSLIYAITKWLYLALAWVHSYVGNYGWAIIILTFGLRLAFFPIMYKSSISMRQTSKKMAKVQPRVKSIQERYRKMKKSMETQRQMNEEIMALYRKEGINPMGNLGGCLPLLLQMPIFIAFYNLLAVTIEMRHAPFIFWLGDLSRRDPYYVTPLLMGASWLAQQAMTSSSIPDPMQRRMMMLMPVMFTFFMMNMPSGLVVYWLTSNILGMIQQWITNKKADHLDALAHAAGSAVTRSRRAEDGQTA